MASKQVRPGGTAAQSGRPKVKIAIAGVVTHEWNEA